MLRSHSVSILATLAALPFSVLAQTATAPARVQTQGSESPVEAAKALLASESYVRPPEAIARLVTAPRHLNVTLTLPSPDRRWFIRERSEGMPDVTSFGKPHYYFAGLQVDHQANRARSLTTRSAAGLELIDAAGGRVVVIETPAGASVSNPVWSPDGKQLGFIAHFESASHVFVADPSTGKARQITRTPLLATLVTSIGWTPDGRIVTVLLPEGRGPEPRRAAVATGPMVRLWMDSVESSQRNFASLLQEPFDQQLMEYFVTGQLALIDVRSRSVTPVGRPAMISAVDPSPDGRWLQVTRLERPFSYVVQYGSFATIEEIWDAGGKVVAVINRIPVREASDTTSAAVRAVRDSAKRNLSWIPDGRGLSWIEPVPRRRAADTADSPQSDQGRASRRSERVVQWIAPFGASDRKVLFQGEGAIADAAFSPDGRTLFVAHTARNSTGEILALSPADTGMSARRVVARLRDWAPSFQLLGGRPQGFGGGRGGSPDDSLSFYQQPGSLALKPVAGTRVVILSGDSAVFLTGTRYSREWQTEGPRRFIDRVTLTSGNKTRIYESPAGTSVELTAPLDDDFTRGIITREAAAEYPNHHLVDFRSGTATPVTRNTDPAPDFTRLDRRRVWITRADGVRFLVKLTLPEGYQSGTRLPGMLWLYPYEYANQADYDRSLRTEDINQYPTGGPRTIEYLATQGYAVANFNPPIIGDQGRMNDSYVSDLRMNLAAVIDELDRQGFIDRARLAIGGHSYGAFSTANAMVHTPFFKAGIAGDGMYNRTLTPNGFQSERRDLWNGQRAYLEMSPMLYAERMQGALLMYHMLEDQNVGTDPISSIRMMQALRAHGKVASLFLYPYEDHGPLAKETILDLWGRWTAWLDVYVKHAGTKPPEKVTEN